MKSNPGIAAVPIQAVAPTKKLAKKWERKRAFDEYKKWERKRAFDEYEKHPFASEDFRVKQSKKKPSASKGKTKLGENVEKANSTTVCDDESSFDFSKVPPPFCSCSGVDRRCYKSGPGGWQLSCCTNALSEYPLPFKPSKPGKRITGRKMRGEVYKKVLCKLAMEGQDLSQPVDLKNHWAKLGTNKFVIIQ